MEKDNITKFPKVFFQLKRPTITASKALKDVIPIKWDNIQKERKNNKNQIVKLVNNKID